MQEISCFGCSGCCKRGDLKLTRAEVDLIVADGGRELVRALDIQGHSTVQIDSPYSPIGIYTLAGSCPRLDEETGLCTIYENRPEVCRDLLLGGKACLAIREQHNK